MGKMCALSTCAHEVETSMRVLIDGNVHTIEVCRSCSKGVIVGTLKNAIGGNSTFRAVRDGCPVCAFIDECSHERNAQGVWVWKK